MRKFHMLASLMLAVLLIVPGSAMAKKKTGKLPSMLKGCKACHEPEPNTIRGKVVGYSEKFKTVSINVGPIVRVIKYNKKTELDGIKSLSDIKKGKETKIVIKGPDKSPTATVIKPKPPLTVADEKQVSFKELKELIQKSPAKGGYTLIDSRPPAAYLAGHVPYAKSLPYPKLKKNGEGVLPKNKDDLLIFYCGGFA